MTDQSRDTLAASAVRSGLQRPETRRNVFVGIGLLLLVLVISFAPTYVARYLVREQLDKFGIDHSGMETLEINPWKREIWVGPIRFRSGKTGYGQVGEFGLRLKLFPFLEKHAMVERVLIRGIVIQVERAKDNTITLNGIPLKIFLSNNNKSSGLAADNGRQWGLGLGRFEMRDSHLIFREETGGMLVIDIDSLLMDDFKSWHPDEPGVFNLQARINDAGFEWNGTAKPFADNISINAEARVRDVEFARIIEFTGPLGLERRSGTYNSRLKHQITVFANGRIEGRTRGKLELIGADYAKKGIFAFAADRADMDLDAGFTLSKENELEIDGRLVLDIVKPGGKLPGDKSFASEKLHVELAGLNTMFAADKSVQMTTVPHIDIQDVSFSGHVQVSMDVILEMLRYLQSLSTDVHVSSESTGLGDWADEEITLPKANISASRIKSTSSKLELLAKAGTINLQLATDTMVSTIRVSTDERETRIGSLHSKLDSLSLKSGHGRLRIGMTGMNALDDFSLTGPHGEAKIASFKAVNKSLNMEMASGRISISASASAEMDGSRLLVYKTAHLPQGLLDIDALGARLGKGTLSFAKGQLHWQFEAQAVAEQLGVDFGKGKVLSGSFNRFEILGASANQNLDLVAESLLVDGLDITLTRRFIDGLLASLKKEAEGQGKEAGNKTRLTNQTRQIQQYLLALGYKPGKADGIAGRATLRAIREFERDSGLPVTGKVTASLLAGLKQKMDHSQSSLPYQLRFGKLALPGGARVRFYDRKVKPRVSVSTVIRDFEVTNLDTRDKDKRAKINITGKVNEFTDIELKGWASNPGPAVNMKVMARLENLELPAYSAYSARYAGVYLESGQLSSRTEVQAKKGKLDGVIMVDARDLKFTPLTEKDAKRLSETAGMPIETVVGMLQDPQGRILLQLPVTGSITKPELDISSAISKAIGSTLKKIFPPTLIASLLSSKKTATGLKFESIKFTPGSAELDSQARGYLDKLVDLLEQRPRLAIRVCGRATQGDFRAVTLISIEKPVKPSQEKLKQREQLVVTHGPALHDLAVERTRVVRRYMINEKGMDAKRVTECRPVFDADDTGTPRVDVRL